MTDHHWVPIEGFLATFVGALEGARLFRAHNLVVLFGFEMSLVGAMASEGLVASCGNMVQTTDSIAA